MKIAVRGRRRGGGRDQPFFRNLGDFFLFMSIVFLEQKKHIRLSSKFNIQRYRKRRKYCTLYSHIFSSEYWVYLDAGNELGRGRGRKEDDNQQLHSTTTTTLCIEAVEARRTTINNFILQQQQHYV